MQTYNVNKFIIDALYEDTQQIGDVSAMCCIPKNATGKAQLLVKEPGILAGVELSKQIFLQVNPQLSTQYFLTDGDSVKIGDVAFIVQGNKQSILTAERLVLNCMQRMSGIATLTHQYVSAIKGTNAKILDTRKTTPNFRYFEKWAVRIGGGTNHRFGLYDMIMIKDNHHDFCGGIKIAIQKAQQFLQQKQLNIPIEIEVRNLEELNLVMQNGQGIVQRVMFDNFDVETTYKAVKIVNSTFQTESSGGINLQTVKEYAQTGVNFISVGALTHSYKSLDLSLKALK